jgi:beta-N-acetylglucosaminidase
MTTEYLPQFLVRNLESDVKCVDLDNFLRNIDSPLLGLGNFIKDCAECFKINELFILAMIGLESGWGKSKIAKTKNNLMGWGAIDSDPMNGAWLFHSKEGCIMTVCRYIDRSYLTKDGKFYRDGTIKGIGGVYSSDPQWAEKICSIMNQIRKFILG